MITNLVKPTFYFFSSRTAIRFHLRRGLLLKGWQEVKKEEDACFSDKNLSLDEEIVKHLEYKHLLAALIEKSNPSLMPLTFWVNDQRYGSVFSEMIYRFYMEEDHYVKEKPEWKWILKPSLLNNGEGIVLFHNVEALKKHYACSQRLGGDHVVQQYITKPALWEGRKYTWRLPVIITNYMGVFAYKEGYVNISAVPFQLEESFSDRRMHVTNYILDGKLALITQRLASTLPEWEKVYPQMRSIIQKVVQALIQKAPFFLKPQETAVFEIFGFDFLQDQQGKVWLLEINQGPGAPIWEENVLIPTLWEPFWRAVIETFVMTSALKSRRISSDFECLLLPSRCYRWWREGIQYWKS